MKKILSIMTTALILGGIPCTFNSANAMFSRGMGSAAPERPVSEQVLKEQERLRQAQEEQEQMEAEFRRAQAKLEEAKRQAELRKQQAEKSAEIRAQERAEHIAAIKAEIDAEDDSVLSDDLLREKFRIQKWVNESSDSKMFFHFLLRMSPNLEQSIATFENLKRQMSYIHCECNSDSRVFSYLDFAEGKATIDSRLKASEQFPGYLARYNELKSIISAQRAFYASNKQNVIDRFNEFMKLYTAIYGKV